LQLNEAAPGLLQLVIEIHRHVKTEQKTVTDAMTQFGKLAVETSLRMPIINLARAICVYDGLDSLDMKESWGLSILVELLEVWLCVATALHEEEPRRSWRYNLVIQCMGIILAAHLGPWMEAAQPDKTQDQPILEMLTVMHKVRTWFCASLTFAVPPACRVDGDPSRHPGHATGHVDHGHATTPRLWNQACGRGVSHRHSLARGSPEAIARSSRPCEACIARLGIKL